MEVTSCSDLVIVTNPNVLAGLTEQGIYPLRACMGRRLNKKSDESAPKYEHLYFTRVKEVKITEERLT